MSILDTLLQLVKGSKPQLIDPSGAKPSPTPTNKPIYAKDLSDDEIIGKTVDLRPNSPTAGQVISGMNTPTPTPAIAQSAVDLAKQFQKGFQSYLNSTGDQQGGNKIDPFIQQFATAAEKYDLFKHNPYLLPAISILETSAGRNITRPNNILNWGINYPGNNEIFKTKTPQEVLDIAIKGLGERSPYYQQFRTGKPLTEQEIQQFAKVYEPANPSYAKNLINAMNNLRSAQ